MSNIFYDRNDEIQVSDSGFLPHWNQYGKIQFVTFRLIDSLPQPKIKELVELKRRFIALNPLPWTATVETEYWKLVSPFESKLLDNGYGSCILRQSDVRKAVSDCLKYFDGCKYDILAYVIMPNHVHFLFKLKGETTIYSVMHSIKSFTAKKINNILQHSGSVWMKEYFDRIVRSERHLTSCINYIRDNPKYLHPSEYELFVTADFDVSGRQDAATP